MRFVGPVGWSSPDGKTATLTANEISYTQIGKTSGAIRLELWAFTQAFSETFRVAHDGERRDQYCAEQPTEHAREPGGPREIGQPSLAEQEEQSGGRDADQQRPFTAHDQTF